MREPVQNGHPANRGVATGSARALLVYLLALAAINLVFVIWWSLTSDHIARESGPIENMQLAALFAAMVVFFQTGRREAGEQRPFYIAAGIACLYLFLRELDFRTLPVAEWIQLLSTDIPRKLIQTSVVVILAVYLLRNFTAIAGTIRREASNCSGRMA